MHCGNYAKIPPSLIYTLIISWLGNLALHIPQTEMRTYVSV